MSYKKPQSALGISLSKKEYAIWECHVEHHGAPPPWPATLGGSPMRSLLAPQSLLEAFLEISKKGFSTKIPKSTFTIHDDIFQRPVELKIFMWA